MTALNFTNNNGEIVKLVVDDNPVDVTLKHTIQDTEVYRFGLDVLNHPQVGEIVFLVNIGKSCIIHMYVSENTWNYPNDLGLHLTVMQQKDMFKFINHIVEKYNFPPVEQTKFINS